MILRRSRMATSVAIAACAALVLSDGSVVVLALPDLLAALDTGVKGVAAVVAVYTGVLAVALLPAERLRRRLGAARLGALGGALFALASLGCGLSASLAPMLIFRALQAAGGAALLIAAFDLLRAGDRVGGGGRLWTLAAVGGAAVGPALGGVLTHLLGWSAIFLAQVPVGLLAAIACQLSGRAATHGPPGAWRSSILRRRRWRAGAALALLSAALSAVLFLVVLMLVAGWGYGPLEAAALLSVLPVAALAAMRVRTEPRRRALLGCLLVASGVASLAAVSTASAWWIVGPELMAGVGMGLALPAFAEQLLPEREPLDAAWVLGARHLGITVALVVLAPVLASELESAVNQTRQREVALMLDSGVRPLAKLQLLSRLAGGTAGESPREDVERAFADLRTQVPASQRPAVGSVARRADEAVVEAVDSTFRPVFLIAAAFALVAALLLLPVRATGPFLALLAIGLALPLGSAVVGVTVAPPPVALADPCDPVHSSGQDAVEGRIERRLLARIDASSCSLGSSREELLLAIGDDDAASRFEREHGVNPRLILLDALIPLLSEVDSIDFGDLLSTLGRGGSG